MYYITTRASLDLKTAAALIIDVPPLSTFSPGSYVTSWLDGGHRSADSSECMRN